MSHEIKTVLGSCGLMVGLNIAPPPPGPIARKSAGGRAALESPQESTKATSVRIAARYIFYSLANYFSELLCGQKKSGQVGVPHPDYESEQSSQKEIWPFKRMTRLPLMPSSSNV